VDALGLADAEAEYILACNRNGVICGDTAYAAVRNNRTYEVERYIPGASLRHREADAQVGETVIEISLRGTHTRLRRFRLIQDARDAPR